LPFRAGGVDDDLPPVIERLELPPLGEDEHGIGPEHLFRAGGIRDLRKELAEVLHRCGVIGDDLSPSSEESVYDRYGPALPDIVGIRFEREPEDTNRPPFQIRDMALEEGEQLLRLLLVDLEDRFEDLQVNAICICSGDESPDVLWKAGASETDPAPEECRAHPAVHPHRREDLSRVYAKLLA